MTIRAIPPGFASRHEAVQRAEQKWGRRDAQGKLKGLLLSGDLIGWDGYDHRYEPQKLLPAFWRSSDSSGLIEEGESYPNVRPRRKYHLLFKAEDLETCFPKTVETEPHNLSQQISERCRSTETDSAGSRNPGGNPGKYDWEKMWAEIAALIYEEGVHGTGQKAEIAFRKKIKQWFEDDVGSAPDDNLIRPKIQKLFKRLRSGPKTE